MNIATSTVLLKPPYALDVVNKTIYKPLWSENTGIKHLAEKHSALTPSRDIYKRLLCNLKLNRKDKTQGSVRYFNRLI